MHHLFPLSIAEKHTDSDHSNSIAVAPQTSLEEGKSQGETTHMHKVKEERTFEYLCCERERLGELERERTDIARDGQRDRVWKRERVRGRNRVRQKERQILGVRYSEKEIEGRVKGLLKSVAERYSYLCSPQGCGGSSTYPAGEGRASHTGVEGFTSLPSSPPASSSVPFFICSRICDNVVMGVPVWKFLSIFLTLNKSNSST